MLITDRAAGLFISLIIIEISYKVVTHNRIDLIGTLISKNTEIVVTGLIQGGSTRNGVTPHHLEADSIFRISLSAQGIIRVICTRCKCDRSKCKIETLLHNN